MKQWTKEDLILFYYDELEQEQRQALAAGLSESAQLQLEYAEICDLLDDSLQVEIPEPSSNLNQNIMASVRQIAEQKTETEKHCVHHQKQNQQISSSWLSRLKLVSSNSWTNSFGAVLATTLLVVSVFYLGRWSAPKNEDAVSVAAETTEFGEKVSRRVMLSNVSTHLEISDRLLTLVSNSNGDIARQIEERRQVIDELVELNRLYRRIAEKSGDTQLASVLQQMESILLELNHTEKNAEPADWQNIRERVDNSDLLFKLRVTNKKLNKEII